MFINQKQILENIREYASEEDKDIIDSILGMYNSGNDSFPTSVQMIIEKMLKKYRPNSF